MQHEFISSIHEKNMLQITFFSKEDGRNLTRKCAPMDYGPSKRAVDKGDRFHLWDFESDKRAHPLLLLPNQIIRIEVLSEKFEPASFVMWKTEWKIPRNWGVHS